MFGLPHTSRRWAVMVFGLTLFSITATGLIAFALQADGRGGKAGWPWAVPFAAVMCLLPTAVFAATLAVAAHGGLALPRARVTMTSALCGAVVPAVLLVVKPLVRWLDIGDSPVGGLAIAQAGMCLLAVGAAGWLSSLSRKRPA